MAIMYVGVATALLVGSTEEEEDSQDDGTHSPRHEESLLHTAVHSSAATGDSSYTPGHHATPTPRDISSSSSEDGIAPSIPRPFPVSPPRHPLRAWDHDDTPSLTATPLPHSPGTHLGDRATDAGVMDSASKSTQTRRPHFGAPKVVTRVLSQPDLSVSDTASTLSRGARSTLSKGAGGRDATLTTGGAVATESAHMAKPPRPSQQSKAPKLQGTYGIK